MSELRGGDSPKQRLLVSGLDKYYADEAQPAPGVVGRTTRSRKPLHDPAATSTHGGGDSPSAVPGSADTDGPSSTASEPGGDPGGGEDFQVEEARGDLKAARNEIEIVVTVLDSRGEPDKAVVTEVREESAALLRLVNAAMRFVEKGQAVPAGLAVSMTVRVELAQDAAKDAETRADGELRGVLEDVLRRLRGVGRRLLSMNLHLFPVKEWSLGGEVSALFVKGTISVTFGSSGAAQRP